MLKKQQWIVVAVAAVLLLVVFSVGQFTPPHEPHADHGKAAPNSNSFEINAFINEQKKGLPPGQSAYLTRQTSNCCLISGETVPGASSPIFTTYQRRLSWKILKKTSTLPPTPCWKN
jgi:hypothetical protein